MSTDAGTRFADVLGLDDSLLVAPRRISCGLTHSLFLQPVLSNQGDYTGSKVFGWGGNDFNQLGLAAEEEHQQGYAAQDEYAHWKQSHRLPDDKVFCEQASVSVAESRDFVEVSCGSHHSMVLEVTKKETNSAFLETHLWSFGLNLSGQLGRAAGDNPRDMFPKKVIVDPPRGLHGRAVVQRVSCGADHTLAIVSFVSSSSILTRVKGRLFAWGLADFGALGTKRTLDSSVPEEVWFPEDVYTGPEAGAERNVLVLQAAAGFKHSVALADLNPSVRTNTANEQGLVYTWGHGGNGRLGLGVGRDLSHNAVFEPRRVSFESGMRMKYVAAGEAHTGALDLRGRLLMWGDSTHGRCGIGLQAATDVATPVAVAGIAGVSFLQLALGLVHSVACSEKGKLYAWGKGPATGRDSVKDILIPEEVSLPDPEDLVSQVSVGPLHTLVLKRSGVLFAFGSGSEYRMPQVGVRTVCRDVPLPQRLMDCRGWNYDEDQDNDNAKEADAGQQKLNKLQAFCNGSSSMLLSSGDLWVWGSNDLASCATPATGYKPVEGAHLGQVAVPCPLRRGLEGLAVVTVAVGLRHCLLITSESILYTWGDGSKGQLGTGSFSYAAMPTKTELSLVTSIAAGEEHSACIVSGQSVYTWGSARGGRLGLGRNFTDGHVLFPTQVEIRGDDDDLKFRDVSCGAEHTALVGSAGHLLTFGVGWFGRLGHGDMENRYVPTLVQNPSLLAKSVVGGMYHTYVVDRNDMLWACGRFGMPGGDCLAFELFVPFAQAPRRQVVSLATCDKHTLVVTRRAKKSSHLELLVWGDNSSGQLGLSPEEAKTIPEPWKLVVAPCNSHQVLQVATGPRHSICVTRKRPGSDRAEDDKEFVFAWGASADARLGLGKSSTEGQPISAPALVNARWEGPRRKKDQTPVEDAPLAQARTVAGPDSRHAFWQQAVEKCRSSKHEDGLEGKRAEVVTMFSELLHDVMSLWSRAKDDGRITEYDARLQAQDMEKEYLRNLHGLRLAQVRYSPTPMLTSLEIRRVLHLYEELLFVLQQQPAYLANLNALLGRHRAENPEVVLCNRVVKQLFKDMRTSRIRNLFKSLLEMTIDNELLRASDTHEFFNPLRSHSMPLVEMLPTNLFYLKDVVIPIVDPANPKSLVHSIIRFTLAKDKHSNLASVKTRLSVRRRKKASPTASLFAIRQEEWEKGLEADLMERDAEELDPDQRKDIRQGFQDGLKRFNHFLCPDASDKEEKEKPKGDSPLNVRNMCDFMDYFIDDVIGKSSAEACLDVQKLITYIYSAICNRDNHDDFFRGENRVAFENETFQPILAVLLVGFLSRALFSLLQGGGLLAYPRMRIRDVVKETIKEVHHHKQNQERDAKVDAQVSEEGEKVFNEYEKVEHAPLYLDRDIGILVKRVEWNINALAIFLRRIVHKEMFDYQYRSGDNEKRTDDTREEVPLRERANVFRDRLTKKLVTILSRPEGSEGAFAAPTTEADLTAELYLSHYEMNTSRVTIKTSDLLEFSNLLWMCMNDRSSDLDRREDRLGKPAELRVDRSESDSPDEDRLACLLREIMPVNRMTNKVRLWDIEGEIYLARQQGESHNFTMRPRFLEFGASGPREATFCRISHAPIPRGLASKDDKKLSGMEPVKPYQSELDRGHRQSRDAGDDVYVFEEIFDFIQLCASRDFRLAGHSFADLSASIEACELKLVGEGVGEQDGELLSKLTVTKAAVDKLRLLHHGTIIEHKFQQWLATSFKRAENYTRYLSLLRSAARKIKDVQTRYRRLVREEHQLLSAIVMCTEACEIPPVISQQRNTGSLAFQKLKRAKLENRKYRPTPAQVVYDGLLRDVADGVDLKELKAMVGFPSRSMGLKELMAKGIVTGFTKEMPRNVTDGMNVMFRYVDEGFNIVFSTGGTMLKETRITREDIMLMQAQGKNATLHYDGLLLFYGGHLVRLFGWIIAEGSL